MVVENALLMCGSYNPVTNLHLRMMEIARDYLRDCGCTVSRGILSPVSDKYKKEGLAPISHREAMLRLALESSDWIELSTWESQQSKWTRSYEVLRFHQAKFNCLTNDKNMNALSATSMSDVNGNPGSSSVNVKYMMGADNLANFKVPIWDTSDIERILVEHGLVVITRSGYDIDSIIYENDILFRNRKRIFVVKEYIENTVSASKIRKACSRGQSIKYLVPDAVERYIKTHGVYSMSSASSCSPEFFYETNRKLENSFLFVRYLRNGRCERKKEISGMGKLGCLGTDLRIISTTSVHKTVPLNKCRIFSILFHKIFSIEYGRCSAKVQEPGRNYMALRLLITDKLFSTKYGNQDSSFSIPASLSNDFQKRPKNIKKTPIPSLKNKPIDKKKKTKTKAGRGSRRSKV